MLRKTLEAVLAIKIDYWYHKDRILEFYINDIFMGDVYPEKHIEKNIFGLESASLFYFSKHVDEISTAKGKVKVLLSLFGRDTPVELDFLQVEKL